MQYQKKQLNKLTKQDRTQEEEHDRILMQYAGIFKNHISEFAERVTKQHPKRPNRAR